ncbi:nephrin-like, partial [Mercenaria mercenaria]|uniref:nephrin-like n=1 Tax=Mercenaria mercenaria TaxID=6596 RepID=UPI00234F14FB
MRQLEMATVLGKLKMLVLLQTLFCERKSAKMNCNFLLSIFLLSILLPDEVNMLKVNSFTSTDGRPEKGSDIIMKCSYTILKSDGLQTLIISNDSRHVASCFVKSGSMADCSIDQGIQNNYNVRNSTETAIEFKISNVQISDAGNWICGFKTQSGDTISLNLAVYVKVTTVTIHDGNASPQSDDIIEVIGNKEKTLTCTTGESNPAPTIIWYIADQKKQNGTGINYTFTPTNDNHNQSIYCKAYNLQPATEAVVSAKPKLFVKVLPSTPSLTNWTSSSPDLFSGEQVTLSCKSTPTRPAVTVNWKKGTSPLLNVRKTASINSVGLWTVLSTVTFTPQKNDNGQLISCETSISSQSPQKVQKAVSVW